MEVHPARAGQGFAGGRRRGRATPPETHAADPAEERSPTPEATSAKAGGPSSSSQRPPLPRQQGKPPHQQQQQGLPPERVSHPRPGVQDPRDLGMPPPQPQQQGVLRPLPGHARPRGPPPQRGEHAPVPSHAVFEGAPSTPRFSMAPGGETATEPAVQARPPAAAPQPRPLLQPPAVMTPQSTPELAGQAIGFDSGHHVDPESILRRIAAAEAAIARRRVDRVKEFSDIVAALDHSIAASKRTTTMLKSLREVVSALTDDPGPTGGAAAAPPEERREEAAAAGGGGGAGESGGGDDANSRSTKEARAGDAKGNAKGRGGHKARGVPPPS